MVIKKPRIVIIGAGMAGLTAANKLYKSGVKKGVFQLCVVEGGNRIGGRIHTSEFGNDRIELGATWIHGIEGSPVYKIAQEIKSLESDQPWECMNGCLDNPITIAENGYVLDSSIVNPISSFFNKLMDSVLQGDNSKIHNGNVKKSVGSFLEKGLESYWKKESRKEGMEMEVNEYGEWNRMTLEESIFEMNENDQRTSTAANDLHNLDYLAEREYVMFPGDEITIPKGYSSVIESLASVLPLGVVQLGKKVCKIEWKNDCEKGISGNKNFSSNSRPVKIHFLDGTSMSADHVVVTVSLGVLKAGIFNKSNSENDLGMFKFDPPLPKYKIEAISRLGYGVVNKLFLKSSPGDLDQDLERFPFLQMVFHKSDHQGKNPKIPWWIRKTTSLSPIYEKSSVLLCWFAGEEALELETLPEEVILDEVSTTISSFFPNKSVKFDKILKSEWGSDPLFKGSYSYIAIGSSIDDLDSLAKPLPNAAVLESTSGSRPLQILFAGEATHRTHYSTTHGAYFSGIREANRLLEHYNCIDV